MWFDEKSFPLNFHSGGFAKNYFFCQIIMGSPLNNNVPEGRSVLPTLSCKCSLWTTASHELCAVYCKNNLQSLTKSLNTMGWSPFWRNIFTLYKFSTIPSSLVLNLATILHLIARATIDNTLLQRAPFSSHYFVLYHNYPIISQW